MGCERLSSEDIADCLGAQRQHVSRKIRQFSERLQISVRQRTEVVDVGRPQVVYFLPVELAKMLAAKHDNEFGNAYLAFLLRCERIATELTPQLVERVKELEAVVERQALELDTAKKVRPIKRLAVPKTMCVTEHITRQDGMFGEVKRQILQARVVNLTRQVEGAARAAKEAQDKLDSIFLRRSNPRKSKLNRYIFRRFLMTKV